MTFPSSLLSHSSPKCLPFYFSSYHIEIWSYLVLSVDGSIHNKQVKSPHAEIVLIHLQQFFIWSDISIKVVWELLYSGNAALIAVCKGSGWFPAIQGSLFSSLGVDIHPLRDLFKLSGYMLW